jgi:hypothetical protein
MRALTLLLCFLTSGCVAIASLMDAVQSAGATPADRRALLPRATKDFNSAVYWGDGSRALTFVEPESRGEIAAIISTNRDKEQPVETSVVFNDFDEYAWEAKVTVRWKYFKIPYYIVEERQQLQEWHYTLGRGWRVVSLKDKKAGS